jgi:hypothetical protein
MTETLARRPSASQETPSTGRQVWNFTRHFLEMCVAMCVGGTALTALVFVAGPALLGYPDLRETAPAAALLIIAVLVTAPMAG